MNAVVREGEEREKVLLPSLTVSSSQNNNVYLACLHLPFIFQAWLFVLFWANRETYEEEREEKGSAGGSCPKSSPKSGVGRSAEYRQFMRERETDKGTIRHTGRCGQAGR